MAVTVLASQGLTIATSKLLLTAPNGAQLIATIANFGGGAQGAAIDTFVSANPGQVKIQELLESS